MQLPPAYDLGENQSKQAAHKWHKWSTIQEHLKVRTHYLPNNHLSMGKSHAKSSWKTEGCQQANEPIEWQQTQMLQAEG